MGKDKKKKHSYNVLSNKKCEGKECDRKLKQNLVDKKPDAKLCYTCHANTQPKNPHVTARQVRTGKTPGRCEGRYALLTG